MTIAVDMGRKATKTNKQTNIYAQHGEDATIRGGWRPCNSHGNYIVDHGKSWKNHGIVFLNFGGNPALPHP